MQTNPNRHADRFHKQKDQNVMPGGSINEDYVGSGDFYVLNQASTYYEVVRTTMLHSTNGRVFVGAAAAPKIDLWGLSIVSSGGLATIFLGSAAGDGFVNVDGTLRNGNKDGSALQVFGKSVLIRIGEYGQIVTSNNSGGTGIWLGANSTNTMAEVVNDGLISANDPIIHAGSETATITNNGTIDILSGKSYRDTYGATDFVINNGVIRGGVLLGGGDDVYDGRRGVSLGGGVYGGAGNDTLYGSSRGPNYNDFFDGGDGDDTILGAGDNDTLRGGSGADRIAGDDGADTVDGGSGNDTLYGGAGDDKIEGGTGTDTMYGGTGNDTFYVNSNSDDVRENAGEGTDTVISAGNFALQANDAVERLQTSNSAGTLSLILIGNDFTQTIIGNAGRNKLQGLGGNDRLDGAIGADTLDGGTGNDTYIVSDAGDVVVEAANAGTDLVQSSVSWRMAANVEKLTLTGTANLNAAGNSLKNTITGNTGHNVLNGGGGSDSLTGGSGADAFVFNTAPGSANIDTITDFRVIDDTIRIDNAVFTAAGADGALSAAAFRIGAAAGDANDRIIYNSSTGALLYDSNGAATGGAIQFAKLHTGLSLTSADFLII